MANMSVKGLPILFCLLVDFPEETNYIDCEVLANQDLNLKNCLKCKKPGKYLFSDRPEDHSSPGHITCLMIWLLLLIIGVFGTFANILVLSVLRKRSKPTSFDILLYVLASFDLINSITSVLSGTGILFYLENWDRGLFTLTYYYLSILLFFFGKTGSSYMTVLITIERYLVISKPTKSRAWFSATRTIVMTIAVILLAVMFNIPRFSSIMVGKNYDGGENVPSLAGKEYIIYSTVLEKVWYNNLNSAHYVDVFAPFPLLLIINALLFVKISEFARMRSILTRKQKSDIRAARMFIPVVVVLFACNILPFAYYIIIRFYNISHRELFFGMLLSVAVNSAANLPIYYARGRSFREEIRATLPEWLKVLFNKLPKKDVTDVTQTATTATGDDRTGTISGMSDNDYVQKYKYSSYIVSSV